MKFIDKTGYTIPVVLRTLGEAKKTTHIRDYMASPAQFKLKNRNLRKKFYFDNKIYGHDDVKQLLLSIQNNKCCYCESRVTHIDYGDVEHIRPKSSYRQGKETERIFPGYFWLVYDWSNLLLSCKLCNETHKNDLYPLNNPKKRCQDHRFNLSEELPQLIDPSRENPTDHLTFKREIVYYKTNKGKVSIKYLGLNREILNESRREILNALNRSEDNYKIVKDSEYGHLVFENFLNQLRDAITHNGQYTAMIQANFPEYIGML